MGHYYGPDVVFVCTLLSLVCALVGALTGWGVAACGAAKGKTVMHNRDFGTGFAAVVAGILLLILAYNTNYTLPLDILVIGFFGPMLLAICLSDGYYERNVLKWIAAADELADKGESVVDLLDADGDSVVSRLDVKANRAKALAQGISANLLDMLQNDMSSMGHNVGSEGSSCYVLGKPDIALAPTRIRDEYKGWADPYYPPERPQAEQHG